MNKRSDQLFQEHENRLHRSTDRVFAGLMVVQWLFAIGCAMVVSPRTWAGPESAVHVHVYAACILGGLLTALPEYLAIRQPGRRTTRRTIAVSQVLFSALLIHLTGGRIETHFHIFGSLAFIAFYRDGHVLLCATAVTAADHVLRGAFWPMSVFGVLTPAPWRWAEHAAWVLFEDAFLWYSIARGTREIRESTDRQARLEETNAHIESVVEERTHELMEARDQALDAARTKADFLTNMSHEIRTPMNGVLGFVHLLDDTPLNDEQREYVNTIQDSGDALLTIINDILDFSKIEAGKLSIESTSFEPQSVMEAVGQLLSTQAEDKGLRFVVEASELAGRTVIGDPTRLRQILLNLAGNSVKFTSAGEVEVRAQIEQETAEKLSICFTVRDTGIGISPEDQARLFQPFEQADTSTTRRFGGTGLGLVICRHLTDLMGGSVQLHSEEGRGSTFTVQIPFLQPSEENDPPKEPSAPANTQERQASTELSTQSESEGNSSLEDRSKDNEANRGLRILLAEDNRVNQRVAVALLKKRGHQVDVADDGEQAVRAFNDGEYDLILMDAQMPTLDGFGATRQIQTTPRGRRVPIVALTAHAIDGYRQKCLDAGMSDYLAKPIVAAELDRVLLEVAAARDGQQAAQNAPR